MCEGVVCERVVCERVMFASWVCVRVRVTNLCVCVKESVCVCDKVVWERVVCNEVVCV